MPKKLAATARQARLSSGSGPGPGAAGATTRMQHVRVACLAALSIAALFLLISARTAPEQQAPPAPGAAKRAAQQGASDDEQQQFSLGSQMAESGQSNCPPKPIGEPGWGERVAATAVAAGCSMQAPAAQCVTCSTAFMCMGQGTRQPHATWVAQPPPRGLAKRRQADQRAKAAVAGAHRQDSG